MAINRAQGTNGTNYKLQEPEPSKSGKTSEIYYEKIDRKTGETKLKSADGKLGFLLMKARGYSLMKEDTARSYLKTQVQHTSVDANLNLKKSDSMFFKKREVIPASAFMQSIKVHQDYDQVAFGIRLYRVFNPLPSVTDPSEPKNST
jgi:hypothetical protein